LAVTATDLEVELVASTDVAVQDSGDITVPGRKFLDILRALPEKSQVSLSMEGEKVVIKAGRSRFSLTTLPAADFPIIEDINAQQTVKITRKELLRLLAKTHFSMAQQDVRYYLNGMLLEMDGSNLRAVATDGHRLALCETAASAKVKGTQQVIAISTTPRNSKSAHRHPPRRFPAPSPRAIWEVCSRLAVRSSIRP
jgi:DNA polymerase-3 subunit beta